MTISAIARGRLTSPVGAGMISKEVPGRSADGMSSSQLQIRMNRKTVTPTGMNFLPRSPMTDWARSLTCSTMNSQITWSLPGTPSVTRERITKPSVRKIAMASRVDVTMSTSIARPKRWTVGWTPTSICLAAYNILTAALPGPSRRASR